MRRLLLKRSGNVRDYQSEAIFYAGEVRRFLRLARLAESNGSRGALIRKAKEAAVFAWRAARAEESRDGRKVTDFAL